MRRTWTEEELIERWTLAPDELSLLANKTGATRLGFAMLLRFFAGEGRFPNSKGDAPGQVIAYLAKQVGVPAPEYMRYDWRGRAIKYHRAQVREHFGFREATAEDGDALSSWLAKEVLPREQDPDVLRDAFLARCLALKIEPPSEGRIERLVASAARRFEDGFCASVSDVLPEEAQLRMEALLASDGDEGGHALRDKTEVVEDERYTKEYYEPNKRAIANAVEVHFNDGTKTEKVEVEYPVGHRRRREEGIPLLEEKFATNLRTRLPPRRAEKIEGLCADRRRLEATPVQELMEMLAI